MTRIAFYPGSFDPVTAGHTDIIERAARLCDELVIGVGVHDAKRPMFPAAERLEMLAEETDPIAEKFGIAITLTTFDGLAVDAAREAGASMIIRGIRDTSDFNYEVQMAGMNAVMADDIETVFLAASTGVRHIAANLVRQIALMGGDVRAFVSPAVANRLQAVAIKTASSGD